MALEVERGGSLFLLVQGGCADARRLTPALAAFQNLADGLACKHARKLGENVAVRLLALEPFLESIGRAMLPRMNMSIYNGPFDCACGATHMYGPHIQLLCEGSMRVVMICPEDDSYCTNVAIKTFMLVKFKGFQSISGFQLKTQDEGLAIATFRSLLR